MLHIRHHVKTACLTFAMVLGLCACVRHAPVRAAAGPGGANDYVDLQPGWRLRVITPILRSGGYQVKSESTGESSPGGTVTLHTDPDFLGYETDFYSVAPRRNGVRVKFESAEIFREGTEQAQQRPAVALFHLPRNINYVRLVYLLRASASDHDMAVLGVKYASALDPLTRQVRSNPASCHKDRESFCSWVPAGIAVRPEKPGAAGKWNPAR